MLYLANPSSEAVREAMRAGDLGQMCTPAEGRVPLPGVQWAADNGCFSAAGYPGERRWLAWLERLLPWQADCLFAVAPDRFDPGLGEEMGVLSLARSRPWLRPVRALGYPVALVAQNGLRVGDVPWAEVDAIFLGGTTEWKTSAAASRLAVEARRRDLHVHMGRVNSGRRWRLAELFCDTADGTFFAFGPDQNLPRQRRWLDHSLFGGTA